jgi:polyhydroxybutyrate depolymerase
VGGSSLGLSHCNPKRPIPVLAFHGTADAFQPYHGGRGILTQFQMLPGAPESIRYWTQWNGCTDKTSITYQRGTATCVTHPDCKQGATVTLCTIEGMGHQWPGHTFTISSAKARQLGMPEMFSRLGPGTNDLDATAMLLRFFQNHPMPASP